MNILSRDQMLKPSEKNMTKWQHDAMEIISTSNRFSENQRQMHRYTRTWVNPTDNWSGCSDRNTDTDTDANTDTEKYRHTPGSIQRILDTVAERESGRLPSRTSPTGSSVSWGKERVKKNWFQQSFTNFYLWQGVLKARSSSLKLSSATHGKDLKLYSWHCVFVIIKMSSHPWQWVKGYVLYKGQAGKCSRFKGGEKRRGGDWDDSQLLQTGKHPSTTKIGGF